MKKLLCAAVALVSASPASAAVVYSENFNGYSGGTSVGQQPGTGLNVYTFGDIPGYNRTTTSGNVNALDRGNGNFAVMFYDTNLIYTRDGVAANDRGVTYTVAFTGSLTTSSNALQVTQPGDYVQFIINDANGTIGSYQYRPDLTTTAFLPYSFSYTGTGTGNIYLVIKDGIDNNGTYGGAIDDIVISNPLAAAVPEPTTWAMMLLGFGMVGGAARHRRRKVTASIA